jgi:hypothetical protein
LTIAAETQPVCVDAGRSTRRRRDRIEFDEHRPRPVHLPVSRYQLAPHHYLPEHFAQR